MTKFCAYGVCPSKVDEVYFESNETNVDKLLDIAEELLEVFYREDITIYYENENGKAITVVYKGKAA